jgi:hypothetical protein
MGKPVVVMRVEVGRSSVIEAGEQVLGERVEGEQVVVVWLGVRATLLT